MENKQTLDEQFVHLTPEAKKILKDNNFGYAKHLDFADLLSSRDYRRAIKLWVMFKRGIKVFKNPYNLEITTAQLDKVLSKELPWYSRFKSRPDEFIQDFSPTAKSIYVYHHIIDDLEKMFEQLEGAS